MVFLIRVPWSIPNAGESVSTFHVNGDAIQVQAYVQAIRTFFTTIAGELPNEVAVTLPSEVVELNDATGTLVATYPTTPGSAVAGTDAGAWAAGSGARIVWSTGVIAAGRRVRGSTFLVPLSSASYTNTGRIGSSPIATIDAAAEAMLDDIATSGGDLAVYSRPRPGRPGASHGVISGATSPQVATLRGRKY